MITSVAQHVVVTLAAAGRPAHCREHSIVAAQLPQAAASTGGNAIRRAVSEANRTVPSPPIRRPSKLPSHPIHTVPRSLGSQATASLVIGDQTILAFTTPLQPVTEKYDHSTSTASQPIRHAAPAPPHLQPPTMPSTSLLRVAVRGSTSFLRASSARPAQPLMARSAAAAVVVARPAAFSTSVARRSEHAEETFEEFSARFEKEFDSVQDVFELQRNLNNAFAYDLVPSPTVIAAALKAARRVNDFATAVRIFEGVKAKVENKGQYEQYLQELKPLREELGVPLKEDLYPEEK
ncbi:cytochrome c oxidase polypeptide vi [Purpureocillium lilacinum]|uniref:Cytochrome c oxidase subunit 6, mitochondrial n=1 Tax=Purpureocillium lilacinum TaxID=33203 RepID=A0A2U3E547_PURLI|nr:cytochrome c oxidase polypeptide vi [Purpureocillium lilacinum]